MLRHFGNGRHAAEYISAIKALRLRGNLGEFGEQLIYVMHRAMLTAGDWAIDGGAAAGRHTIELAISVGSTGRVLAFEPGDKLRKRLAEAIQTHLLPRRLDSRVTVIPMAISDEHKIAIFEIVPDDLCYSGLHAAWKPAGMGTIDVAVECVRLDDEIADEDKFRIKFIKLDLEGGEYHALEGARQIMKAGRPIIAFECGRFAAARIYGFTENDFFELFDDLRYDLFCDFFFPLTRTCWSLPFEQMPSNYFAVPRERSPVALFAELGDRQRAAFEALIK